MKAVFMGSPEIAVPFLDFLIKKNVELIVFTQKDKIRCRGKNCDATPVKKHAATNNIEVFECSAKSDKAFEIINEFKPDIFLVVAYGQILPERILSIPKFGPINVHFSLLPKYRGATPVNSSLLNGDSLTGTTIMLMDKGLDTGNIIYQKKIEVDPSDNSCSLFKKLINLSLDIIGENWNEIETGSFKSTPQAGDATLTKLILKDDLFIDWNDSSEHIFNKIRAFNAQPGTKTCFRQRLLFIEKAKLLSDKEVSCCHSRADGNPSSDLTTDSCLRGNDRDNSVNDINLLEHNPGEIIAISKNSFSVACGMGFLEIETVKPEGKKSMPACAFIAGYRPQIGEFLEVIKK